MLQQDHTPLIRHSPGILTSLLVEEDEYKSSDSPDDTEQVLVLRKGF